MPPTPRRSATGGTRPAEVTRAKMVDAALAVLHEDGILGASARAIARRGGFNQALIFYHFSSVHELLLAAVDQLSARRCERYERRLAQVSTLRELVVVAGELHAEDLEDGHITVLSQMLAAAATNPDLRQPMADRFQPWIDIVERAVVRVLDGTPYAGLLPVADLALAITGEFIGIELLLNLSDDEALAGPRVFRTFEMLATVLEALPGMTP
jgi:AcrR family transcriptional regulator